MDRTPLAAALSAASLAAACGVSGATTDASDAAEQPPATIAVTAVDYGFEGVPAEAAAGSRFTLTNRSDTEVHELVAIRLHDDEDRPLAELLQLPDDERAQVGVPVGVTVALPGEEGVEPRGAWTVSEPGRYVLVCMIPQGADVAAFRDAPTPGDEPATDTEAGPPHAALGMVAEITVR